MSLWHAAAAVVLAGLLTGCEVINGTGCSDVGWQSNVIIRLDPAVERAAETLEVQVCQDDRRGDATVPARGKGRETYLAVDELGQDFDSDTESSLVIEARSADGFVVARHEEFFEFEDWHPDGPGCGSWLRHRAAVDADDLA